MKKLLFAIISVLALAACDKDEHRIHYQDMMCFTEGAAAENGYVSSITNMSAESGTSVLELFVMRSMTAARNYPRQTACIVVDKEKSTAAEGSDFTLSTTTFDFESSDIFRLPFTIDIHDAAGKTIVLKLDYAYYDECPADVRKEDRLTIRIQ